MGCFFINQESTSPLALVWRGSVGWTLEASPDATPVSPGLAHGPAALQIACSHLHGASRLRKSTLQPLSVQVSGLERRVIDTQYLLTRMLLRFLHSVMVTLATTNAIQRPNRGDDAWTLRL